MRTSNRLLAATGAIGVAIIGFLDAVLDKLGYATTVAPFLPLAWRQAIVSDPVLIWGAGLLLLIAIALLWSIARDSSKAAKEYRKSNEKAWEFNGEFAGLREDYRAIQRNQEELLEQFRKARQQLDALERSREQTGQEIQQANAAAITEAVNTAVNSAAEQMYQHRDRTATDLQTRVSELRTEFEFQLQDVENRFRAVALEEIERSKNQTA